jgi:hypothetical protein
MIGCTLFAVTGFIKWNDTSSYPSRRAWGLLLAVSIAPLSVLPILISQRLLLATALVGSVVIYATASDEGVPLTVPILVFIFMFSIWTAQELVRVGFRPGAILDSLAFSANKLLYYFSNDVGNANRAVSFLSRRAYGTRSFRFIFEYTFTINNINREILYSFYQSESIIRAGGNFTGVGAPYADFGHFGLIFIFFWGYVSRVFYQRSANGVVSQIMYALFASTILLSWHAPLYSNPLFIFNIAVVTAFGLLLPTAFIRLYMSRNTEVPNS